MWQRAVQVAQQSCDERQAQKLEYTQQVKDEDHQSERMRALPPAPLVIPEVVEAGDFYYKPVPEGSVPHSETYFKVGSPRMDFLIIRQL